METTQQGDLGSAIGRQAIAIVGIAQVYSHNSPPALDRWIIDSDASYHMTCCKGYFHMLRGLGDSLSRGQQHWEAAGKGAALLPLPSGDIILNDVHCFLRTRFVSALSLVAWSTTLDAGIIRRQYICFRSAGYTYRMALL
jgi:hypothetical protein